MPKVVKAASVLFDAERRVSIEAMDFSFFNAIQTQDGEFCGGQDEEPTRNVIHMIEKATVEAQEIIGEAKEEAKRVVGEARAQSEKAAADLQAKRSREGYEEGYARGIEEAGLLKEEALKVLEDANVEREKILSELEPQIINLVAVIAEKLIMNSVNVNPDTILYLLRVGLSGATIGGDVNIRVSPNDYRTLTDNLESLLPSSANKANLEVIQDGSLNPSDCIIETSLGNIDCSLDQQFRSLKNELFMILGNNT